VTGVVTGARAAGANRSRLQRAALLVTLATSLALAGCVGVPTDGPVVEGRPAGDPVAPPNVAVLPLGPSPGDEPLAIVEGFLSAMASYEPGYPTARQFLTPVAAGAWEPESGIAVYGAGEGSRSVSETDDGVQISLRLEARVAADGSYSPVEPDSRLSLDLALEQVNGQWRIATPPEGLVMAAFDFDREFAAFSSYFFDPGYEVLVPDLTYLPVRGNIPTLLVEELLDGPTEWLDPGVRTAFDPGVTLRSGSVVQSGTVAQVDLSGEAAAASTEQRDRMAAQLAWTLRQAPGVGEVVMLADGRAVAVSGATEVVDADAFAFYDPAAVPAGDLLVAVTDGGVVAVGEQPEPLAGPLGEPGPYRSVAISLTGTRGAAVSADGTAVTTSGLSDDSTAVTTTVGSNLAPPSIDRAGRIWLVDRTGETSSISVIPPDGEPVDVDSELVEATAVDRLVISADGVRAALVYEAEGIGRLALALVLPRADGSLELGSIRDIPLGDVDGVDVAWTSATALALLADSGEGPQPFIVELANGALSSRGQVSGAVSVAASPGQPLVIGAQSDDEAAPVVLRQDALQEWVPLLEASAPTYPG
jgi:hypothetical protein